MSPLGHKDFHGLEEFNRYSLRARYSENSFQELRNFDASRINGKADFFFSMGLQMRNLGNVFRGNFGIAKKCEIKRFQTSSVVKLRECSVVVLGTTCHACGKHFKCKTDLDAHVAVRHFTFVGGTNNYADKIQRVTVGTSTYGNIEELECTPGTGRSAEKIHRGKSARLCLTLKIGPEVITRVAIKRKHLAARTIVSSAETEFNDDNRAATQNDENKGHTSLVHDDHLECRVSNVRIADKENHHFDGNVTPNRRLKHVECNVRTESEITEEVRPSCIERITEIQGPLINFGKDSAPSLTIIPDRVPILSNTTSMISSTQTTRPFTRSAAENRSHDEVQEVLRITRGRRQGILTTEINHESPNRLEREILVLDAIKDMLRIEQSGLRLMEENSTNDIVCHNYGTNVERVLDVKVFPVAARKSDFNQVGSHASDASKENVITGNRYLNTNLEELSNYGINFYNDTSEINCNQIDQNKVSEPKSDFSTPRYSGTERKYPKPTIVIDLVNDDAD